MLLSCNVGAEDVAVPWMLVAGGNAAGGVVTSLGLSGGVVGRTLPAECALGTTGKALVAGEGGGWARSQKLLLSCMHMRR